MYEDATVRVRCVEARNLPKADTFGLSDPFCEVKIGMPGQKGKQFYGAKKTQIIKKTLNPYWDEEFAMRPQNPSNESIDIYVYDWDRFMRDDLLGFVSFPISSLQLDVPVDRWYPLHHPKKSHQGGCGEIHLVITYSNSDLKKSGAGRGAGAAVPPAGAGRGIALPSVPGRGTPLPTPSPAGAAGRGAPAPTYQAPPAGRGAPAPTYQPPPAGRGAPAPGPAPAQQSSMYPNPAGGQPRGQSAYSDAFVGGSPPPQPQMGYPPPQQYPPPNQYPPVGGYAPRPGSYNPAPYGGYPPPQPGGYPPPAGYGQPPPGAYPPPQGGYPPPGGYGQPPPGGRPPQGYGLPPGPQRQPYSPYGAPRY